jgi:glycosyltransferase involved in cell wall biosynthesis
MRVLYDAQTFLRQRTGGISRLFTDLIQEFDRHPALGVQAAMPFRLSNNSIAARDLGYRGLHSTPLWLPRSVLYAPWWLRGSRVPTGCDIVHRTYYSERFLGVPAGIKQVTTVYDMIPELFTGTDQFTATHLQKRQYVSECDLVICISESTRQDMVAIYGDVARNVRVIPLAVQAGFGPDQEQLPGLPSQYVMYVGARKGYKDFGLLPKALQMLRSQGHEVPLVIVGKPLAAEEEADIARRGLASSTVCVQLTDSELKRAYAHSSALVQTSRYEGFGLTPLEGMASGAPVVVAYASSMPEVGGDVAQYFAPGDAEDLARVMLRSLTDEELRVDLAERGPARAAGFSTAQMARRTAEAYADLLR